MKKIDLTRVLFNKELSSAYSAGMFPKAKIEINSKKYWIKLSAYNIDSGVYGIESISEVIASRVIKRLGFKCLNYQLVNAKVDIDGKVFSTYACLSKDFNPRGRDTLTIEELFNTFGEEYNSPEQFLYETGRGHIVEEVYIIDFILNNIDRHGANTEFMNVANRLDLVPYYDHGLSLLNTQTDERLNFDISTRANNYIGSYDLMENLKKLEGKEIEVNKLTKNGLFTGLVDSISEERKVEIWKLIESRYKYARDIKAIKEIS